jgi:hypothetical protein
MGVLFVAHYINFFGANSRDLRRHDDYLASTGEGAYRVGSSRPLEAAARVSGRNEYPHPEDHLFGPV